MRTSSGTSAGTTISSVSGGGSSGAGGGGNGNRVATYLANIPAITKVLLGINISIHALIFILSGNLNHFAINANLVVVDGEYYRIVSAAFVHSGIMHIGMNMMSLLQLGHSLELQFGSLQFLFLTLWTVLVAGGIYVGFYWSLFRLTGNPSFLGASGVGFSGVLFCYALLEAFHSTETTRSVFGLFNVPAKLYPFILLILIQVMLPGISFMGHLSGILVGILTITGFMQVLMPSQEFLSLLEHSSYLSPITRINGYIWCNGRTFVHPSFESMTFGQTICACMKGTGPSICYAVSLLWSVLSAFLLLLGCQPCVDKVAQTCSSLGATLRSFTAGGLATSRQQQEGLAMGVVPAHVTQTANAFDGRGAYTQVPRAVPLADVEGGDIKPIEKGKISI